MYRNEEFVGIRDRSNELTQQLVPIIERIRTMGIGGNQVSWLTYLRSSSYEHYHILEEFHVMKLAYVSSTTTDFLQNYQNDRAKRLRHEIGSYLKHMKTLRIKLRGKLLTREELASMQQMLKIEIIGAIPEEDRLSKVVKAAETAKNELNKKKENIKSKATELKNAFERHLAKSKIAFDAVRDFFSQTDMGDDESFEKNVKSLAKKFYKLKEDIADGSPLLKAITSIVNQIDGLITEATNIQEGLGEKLSNLIQGKKSGFFAKLKPSSG